MVNNLDFIPLKEILSRVTRHPLLQDVDLEAGIQYTIDFLGIVGLPDVFEDKLAHIHIHNFRGELPCDLISVIQVKDEKSKTCLRYMTDTFNTASRPIHGDLSFKTQGRYITTSFKEGDVLMSYKSIRVDEDELPMLPDHPAFQKALESYIKKEVFTVLFDTGKIRGDVLAHAEQDYYWNVGKCTAEFKIPSISEMQSITGMMHRMIPSQHEFGRGFKTLGDREYYKRH